MLQVNLVKNGFYFFVDLSFFLIFFLYGSNEISNFILGILLQPFSNAFDMNYLDGYFFSPIFSLNAAFNFSK